MEGLVKDVYPLIFREAVKDPDPWKSLQASVRIALVNKLFKSIVQNKLRPEILERLLPGLDKVRMNWLKCNPKEFAQQLNEWVAGANKWRTSKITIYESSASTSRPMQAKVRYDVYPRKDFDPLKHTLGLMMVYDVHRLVETDVFKTAQDAVVWRILFFCVQQLERRVKTSGEKEKGLAACSQLWNNYCSSVPAK